MGDQRFLHLKRGDPDTADLQHLIAAALEAKVAVGIAGVGVAGVGPFTLKRAPRLDALVPVALGRAVAADDQFAGFAVRHRPVMFIDNAGFVTWNRLAAGAIADIVRTVADEDMQHLGRADTVQNIDADHRLPSCADIGRQRLARRDAAAKAGGTSARGDRWVGQKSGV